jgi:hypothetical protein
VQEKQCRKNNDNNDDDDDDVERISKTESFLDFSPHFHFSHRALSHFLISSAYADSSSVGRVGL